MIDDCPSAPWPGDPEQYRRKLGEVARAIRAEQAKATQARFLGAEAAQHPQRIQVTPSLLRAVTWRLCFERTMMLLESARWASGEAICDSADLWDGAIESQWNSNALKAAQAFADILVAYAIWPVDSPRIASLVRDFGVASSAAMLWRSLYLRRQIERC